jgi:hypothetical protein
MEHLHGFIVRKHCPFGHVVRIGGPPSRRNLVVGHPVQHVQMRHDRRSRIAAARIDRIDHRM